VGWLTRRAPKHPKPSAEDPRGRLYGVLRQWLSARQPAGPEQSSFSSLFRGVFRGHPTAMSSVGMQPSGCLQTAQFAVLLGEARPLVGHGALMEDGVHRALRLAGATLDAFVRVDVVHVRGLVNT